jgi:Ca2+-binding RTX toxin-like protein
MLFQDVGTSNADYLMGTLDLFGSGGTSADTYNLQGLEGNDTLNSSGVGDSLNGGPGNDILIRNTHPGQLVGDVLTGGLGNDLFDFVGFDRSIDRIADFTPGEDKIVFNTTGFQLSQSSFVGNGYSNLLRRDFAVVSNNKAAKKSTAKIVYNSKTGALFYNPNQNAPGFGKGGQFAVIESGLTLTANSFLTSSSGGSLPYFV